MGFSRQLYWSGAPLRAVLSGSRPQHWWHWLHTLTLPWFFSLLLLLFLQTSGWEIVQSWFLLRCWYSECWKRNAVGEGPSELCLGSWQCRVEEEGPSLCPGRCLAVGRSQALFRSQLSYLPTVWPWVDSVPSLNLLSAVCGFALNHSHSPSPNIFPCEEPGCHSFPGIPRPSLLSLVFSSFSQRAFPLPVFPQITPETFLFPQSSSSSPLSGPSSSTTVLSANAVTRSQVKGFIVGVRTWSGIGSPHFSWTLLALEHYTVLHGQILVLPGWWKHGCFALSL